MAKDKKVQEATKDYRELSTKTIIIVVSLLISGSLFLVCGKVYIQQQQKVLTPSSTTNKPTPQLTTPSDQTTNTATPAQNSSPASNTKNTPVNTKAQGYTASVCTKTILPKTMVRQPTTSLTADTEKVYQNGVDGYIQTCTADSTGYKPSDIRVEPINGIIMVSTYPNQKEINTCMTLQESNYASSPYYDPNLLPAKRITWESYCSAPSEKYM